MTTIDYEIVNATEANWEEHPDAAIFCMLEGKEYEQFKAGVEEAGAVFEPVDVVLVADDYCQLADGRNRRRVAQELGFPLKVNRLPNGIDVKAYIISKNLHRRHLTPAQLAWFAANMVVVRHGDFHGNQYTRGDGSGNFAGTTPGTIQAAAEATGLSPRTIQDAVYVKDHDPEVFEDLKHDKTTASRAAKESRKKQEEEKGKKKKPAQTKQAKPETPTPKLECSFCSKSNKEVSKLIAGPTAFICDECVELCTQIIRDEDAKEVATATVLLSPKTRTIAEAWDIFCAAWQAEANTGTFVEDRVNAKDDVMRALYGVIDGILTVKRLLPEADRTPAPEASTSAEADPAPERCRRRSKRPQRTPALRLKRPRRSMQIRHRSIKDGRSARSVALRTRQRRSTSPVSRTAREPPSPARMRSANMILPRRSRRAGISGTLPKLKMSLTGSKLLSRRPLNQHAGHIVLIHEHDPLRL